ncbi:ScbR family autoregulator-binding transcription factor [soil metagenome]
MVRQARSEATRRRILDAAIELFSEVGFAATSLGDILERAELTKGALYYHFESKESLASAIIEEAAATIFDTISTICASAAPAMENLIHSSFAVAGLITTDAKVRTGIQIARGLGEFNDVVAQSYKGATELVVLQLTAAESDGDLRSSLPSDAVAETLLAAYLGAELLTGPSTSSADLFRRLTRIWDIMLPAIVDTEALPFLRQFLSREALRHGQRTLQIE